MSKASYRACYWDVKHLAYIILEDLLIVLLRTEMPSLQFMLYMTISITTQPILPVLLDFILFLNSCRQYI